MNRTIAMLGLLLASCGTSQDEALVDAHAARIAELRALSTTHAAEVERTSDMAALAELEREHHVRMGAAMDALAASDARLMGCERLCCMDSRAMRRAMGGEATAHQDRMRSAADLGAARGEESRHQRAMTVELDDLDAGCARLQRMMGMGMDMGCPSAP